MQARQKRVGRSYIHTLAPLPRRLVRLLAPIAELPFCPTDDLRVGGQGGVDDFDDVHAGVVEEVGKQAGDGVGVVGGAGGVGGEEEAHVRVGVEGGVLEGYEVGDVGGEGGEDL